MQSDRCSSFYFPLVLNFQKCCVLIDLIKVEGKEQYDVLGHY